MNVIKMVFIGICLMLLSAENYAQNKTQRLDSLVTTLFARGQFNGSIVVGVDGHVLYEKAQGYADEQAHNSFTVSTPCSLASVSKQFTAMAILILVSQNSIGLDDHLDKYFPDFPNADKITVRHLLNHTSGIPNYEGLGIDHPGLTNAEFYKAMLNIKNLEFKPGDQYSYSNSGYILLAMLVEKISGLPFGQFLQQRIFAPLQMNSTWVLGTIGAPSVPIARAYSKFGSTNGMLSAGTTGDGGVVSTVEDLFKWDQALYTNKLVPQTLLLQAFEPALLNDGKRADYGLGWMIGRNGNEKFVYHTGGSGGYRTYMSHYPDSHIAVIILTNHEDSPRREINEAIVNILNNKPFTLPKMSVAIAMYNIYKQRGIDGAINFYQEAKLGKSAQYDFSEQELNLLGYQVWSVNKIDDAIAIFKLNVAAYPASSNTYESLGEAYLKKGDKQLAMESFNKSLGIDPHNSDAARMIKQIK